MRYFKNKPIFILLLSSLLISTIALDIGAVENHIKYYGGLAKKYPYQAKVHEIFERVQKTAIHNEITHSKLHIVNGRPNDPFTAIALSEGNIILSKPVVEFIYNNVDEKQGHVRLAFILGHELAHVVHGDASQKFNDLSASQKQEKERQADEQGFLYAAMAGYAVDKLLRENGENFFVAWIKETDAKWGLKTSYPDVEERAKALFDRLKSLLENLPYFQFGVRLAHFGRCDDAIAFFDEFKKVFPAREVYNNWGGCKLHEAQKLLEDEASSYWLVPMLEVATQIDKFSLPAAPKGKPQRKTLAINALIEAKKYFEWALKRDAFYVPAQVNLAITLFYLEKMGEARQAIETAQKLAPNNLEIQSLQAVIRYQKDKQSLSVQELNHLATQANIPPNILYNTAQLLEQKAPARAKKFWQKLAQLATVLPDGIRAIVCQKQDCSPQHKLSPKTTWKLPVTLGAKTRHHKQILRQWQKSRTRLHNLYEQIYRHPKDAIEVLALGGRIKMVVLKKLGKMTQNTLPAYCGQALHQRRVMKGTLLSCENHWTAWVVDDNVKEIWLFKDED